MRGVGRSAGKLRWTRPWHDDTAQVPSVHSVLSVRECLEFSGTTDSSKSVSTYGEAGQRMNLSFQALTYIRIPFVGPSPPSPKYVHRSCNLRASDKVKSTVQSVRIVCSFVRIMYNVLRTVPVLARGGIPAAVLAPSIITQYRSRGTRKPGGKAADLAESGASVALPSINLNDEVAVITYVVLRWEAAARDLQRTRSSRLRGILILPTDPRRQKGGIYVVILVCCRRIISAGEGKVVKVNSAHLYNVPFSRKLVIPKWVEDDGQHSSFINIVYMLNDIRCIQSYSCTYVRICTKYEHWPFAARLHSVALVGLAHFSVHTLSVVAYNVYNVSNDHNDDLYLASPRLNIFARQEHQQTFYIQPKSHGYTAYLLGMELYVQRTTYNVHTGQSWMPAASYQLVSYFPTLGTLYVVRQGVTRLLCASRVMENLPGRAEKSLVPSPGERDIGVKVMSPATAKYIHCTTSIVAGDAPSLANTTYNAVVVYTLLLVLYLDCIKLYREGSQNRTGQRRISPVVLGIVRRHCTPADGYQIINNSGSPDVHPPYLVSGPWCIANQAQPGHQTTPSDYPDVRVAKGWGMGSLVSLHSHLPSRLRRIDVRLAVPRAVLQREEHLTGLNRLASSQFSTGDDKGLGQTISCFYTTYLTCSSRVLWHPSPNGSLGCVSGRHIVTPPSPPTSSSLPWHSYCPEQSSLEYLSLWNTWKAQKTLPICIKARSNVVLVVSVLFIQYVLYAHTVYNLDNSANAHRNFPNFRPGYAYIHTRRLPTTAGTAQFGEAGRNFGKGDPSRRNVDGLNGDLESPTNKDTTTVIFSDIRYLT
ncbi:hypothetical protein ACRALDRAFT_207001 [Sodiomyces alcalophilus JCM 7366]|uniref:uncharacterized protein n=1 Tax=Sodiomyces alcalophilus JCM 7366 TaxID=591952 RepID=UPI0039B6A728